MKIKDILSSTNHRPWALPSTKWEFYQEWNKVIFLHWEVDLSLLEESVPPNIEIDLFNGKAWVSLVAFTMEKIRPRNLPYMPLISNFDEINIRTYVKYNGKAGVHFLSIEAGSKISSWIARKISGLPYCFTQMERSSDSFRASNDKSNTNLEIKYSVKQHLSTKSKLDKWLTERYALFQDTPNGINAFDIHHIEWPLFNIDLNQVEIRYPKFSFVFKKSPDLFHYSPGVQVLSWDKIFKETVHKEKYIPTQKSK